MSPVTAACPNCGAAVEFRYDDTFVRVCPYCNAVIARGDRGFESLGRMGDLATSESPLALYARGQLDRVGFELVGRAQIAHSRGGGWEEWYVRFDSGVWGWLSEAQGRFQLSFAAPPPPDLPAFERLAPGQRIPLALPGYPAETFTVAEVGQATYRAAAGEMPYRLEPGLRFRFADLSGERGGVATLDAGVDAGDALAVYIGREVGLAELNLPSRPGGASGAAVERVPGEREAGTVVAAHHVACVKCGGSLALAAPDAAQRVTCPYCSAILDISQGHLSYLRTLDPNREVAAPEIPLGTTAAFDGQVLTVIGCLRRSVRVDGTDYSFTEYLLYHPAVGYRWLVESDGQWNYVTPIGVGAVVGTGRGPTYGGRRFRHFQTSTARVDALFGEFYWKVEPGERVEMSDFVSPPHMLSRESSEDEVQWSIGAWMEPREVSERLTPPGQAPGSLDFKAPLGVGPNQPFPHQGILRMMLLLVAILLVAAVFVGMRAPDRLVDVRFEDEPASSTTAKVDPNAPLAEMPPNSRVFFSRPFALVGGKNVAVTFRSGLDNSWLYFEGDLVNEDTGAVDSFDAALEWYSGVEDGESWSEGDRDKTIYVGAVPAGHYVLRLDVQWPDGAADPTSYDITVREGVFRGRNLVMALGLLLVVPIVVLLRWLAFEQRRWAESDHPWFSGGDDE